MNDKHRAWLDRASGQGGSFVSTFANACFAADDANFQLMKPVLEALMLKYPAYLETW